MILNPKPTPNKNAKKLLLFLLNNLVLGKITDQAL